MASDYGYVVVLVLVSLNVLALLLRKLQQYLTKKYEVIDSRNLPAYLDIPDIFIISIAEEGLREEQIQIENATKYSYENLAPPLYSLENDKFAKGSYELPPEYPSYI